MKREGGSRFYLLVLGYSFVFLLWYGQIVLSSVEGRTGWPGLVLILKGILEILISFFLFSNLLKSFFYLVESKVAAGSDFEEPPGEHPPMAAIYLCCEDLDRGALESLFSLEYPGSFTVIVHDDSRDPETRARTRTLAESLGRQTGRPMLFLSRPDRTGGKPAAVEFVLREAGDRFDYFLLCDNDSTALEPDCLLRALPRFRDPRVAAVQFRNVGLPATGESAVASKLAAAIDSFQVFLQHQSRHGWMPFVGHNALLRKSAVLDVGGPRAGYLSDDIDLSLRFYLKGYRVTYDPGIRFGETHPPSYQSFRARSRKWAFGCLQVLHEYLIPVLRSRQLKWTQKLGFLEFAGFYVVQAALLFYLFLTYLCLPFVLPGEISAKTVVVFPGLLVLFAIFSPTLAYFLKEGRVREWPEFAWLCTLVYGSAAFSTTRGLMDYLTRGSKEWIPTNGCASSKGGSTTGYYLEFLFGSLLFVVPLVHLPVLLYSPASYLFISIFLFTPLLDRWYRPGSIGRSSTKPIRGPGLGTVASRSSGLMVVLLLSGSTLPFAGCAAVAGEPEFSVEEGRILRNGKEFRVTGIHYSPWRPGTGPAKDYPWPEESLIREDLRLLKELGGNTIEVQDAPEAMVRMAEEEGLAVLYVFYIDWQKYFQELAERIRSTLEELRGSRNLLGWILGHEVTQWVRDEVGNPFLEERLHKLYRLAKSLNPHQLVTHANWPVTKDLNLGFLDFTSFNLYPAWPREVVVKGYGNYIQDVLLPIAGDRPLVITEFGVNTLESDEATQAAVIKKCWEEIRTRTAGGVVFEFADEWWKNYDNPIREGEWWEREHAPQDEKVHDLDPEEYYGIVRTNREPKPAFQTVQKMYSRRSVPREVYLGGVLVALMAYTFYVVRRSPPVG